MSLGMRLKKLRESKNIERDELARVLGLTYWALSKYEQDQRQPDYDVLKKFAAFFNVSVDDLLNTGDGWLQIPETTGKAADDMRKIFEEHENDKIDAIISPEQLDDIISPYLSEKLTDDVKQKIKEQIIDNIKRIRKNEGKDV